MEFLKVLLEHGCINHYPLLLYGKRKEKNNEGEEMMTESDFVCELFGKIS